MLAYIDRRTRASLRIQHMVKRNQRNRASPICRVEFLYPWSQEKVCSHISVFTFPIWLPFGPMGRVHGSHRQRMSGRISSLSGSMFLIHHLSTWLRIWNLSIKNFIPDSCCQSVLLAYFAALLGKWMNLCRWQASSYPPKVGGLPTRVQSAIKMHTTCEILSVPYNSLNENMIPQGRTTANTPALRYLPIRWRATNHISLSKVM